MPAYTRLTHELGRSGMTRENCCYVAAQNITSRPSRGWKESQIAPELSEQEKTKLQEEQ